MIKQQKSKRKEGSGQTRRSHMGMNKFRLMQRSFQATPHLICSQGERHQQTKGKERERQRAGIPRLPAWIISGSVASWEPQPADRIVVRPRLPWPGQ